MTGARATYDAGIVKVYAGAGKVDNQLMAPVYEYIATNGLIVGYDENKKPIYLKLNGYAKSYVEAGITGKINVMNYPIELGLHAYNESGGRDVYVASAGTDFGIVSLGLDIDYFHADDNLKKVTVGGNKVDLNSSAWGAALCANVKPLANFQVPVRIEYVNNQDSFLVVPLAKSDARAAWSFTITPTYNPTKNTFIRAEFAYTKGTSTREGAQDSYVFKNSDGGPETSRTVGAVELGFLF